MTTNPQNDTRAASQLLDMGRSCKEQRRREPGVTREGPLSRGRREGRDKHVTGSLRGRQLISQNLPGRAGSWKGRQGQAPEGLKTMVRT